MSPIPQIPIFSTISPRNIRFSFWQLFQILCFFSDRSLCKNNREFDKNLEISNPPDFVAIEYFFQSVKTDIILRPSSRDCACQFFATTKLIFGAGLPNSVRSASLAERGNLFIRNGARPGPVEEATDAW